MVRYRTPRILESRQMGRLLNVPGQWLRNELKRGTLPGVAVDDDRAIFAPREVERALAERCRFTPPQQGGEP